MVKDLGLKKVIIFSLNTDWGKNDGNLVEYALKQVGVYVSSCETYLIDEKDFRSFITKTKTSSVDGIVLVSFITDASLFVQQLKLAGGSNPIIAHGALTTGNKFSQLAGIALQRRVHRWRLFC